MIMFADPKEWWLELSPTAQADAVQQSQRCSTPNGCQTAYLNALCLNGVLDWLRADVPDATSWLALDMLPAIWDVVNGTAVTLGAVRLVLIPTEVIDDSELEVPQEWVDSPSWAGDYYLAVQVEPESGWVRIWGYTTHQELKSLGQYDPLDRTYSLSSEQLTQDLNAFWATYQFCGADQTRLAIAPLPELSASQAETLIQRLGDSALVFPRLEVPFSLWGALLARSQWRQALYAQRCGVDQARSPLVRLSDWLQGQFASTWQAVDAVLLPAQVATAWRSGGSAAEAIAPEYAINRVKVLELGEDSGEGAIALLIGMTPISDRQVNLGLHVCPLGESATFLAAIQVRLLDGSGTEVGQASATVTETIQFQFRGQVREKFGVEVTISGKTLTECFEI
ncbi:MAG: DUF1822 family protein [Leptolyngbyaceae cyanobacterium RU_5_1]|nr:DUF1822 family protein [Leptolyngbyaceae cyanobacterium RU_5_1]